VARPSTRSAADRRAIRRIDTSGDNLTSVVFSEPDAIFTLIAAVLSPAVAELHLDWLDAFVAGDEASGSEVVERLRVHYGLDRFEIHCTIADSREQLLQEVGTATVLVCDRETIDDSLLARAGHLVLVQKLGTDLRRVDTKAAAARGVGVAAYRRGGGRRVAEHTVGLMLALVKGLFRGDRAIRAGVNADARGPRDNWAYNWPEVVVGGGLYGLSLGIVGLGEVGIEVARFAKAFGMDIAYYQRKRHEQREEEVGARYVSLEELFSGADVVDVHLPVTPATRGVIGAAQLALMKPTAYLVNTSRASVIDEVALVDVLERGVIAGAALDNFWREPLPLDHPLIGMENVILTPHIAGGAFDAQATIDDVGGVLDNIARVLTDRPVLDVVGRSSGSRADHLDGQTVGIGDEQR
jgi:D-3-phosphoglycerate dehydrogenase